MVMLTDQPTATHAIALPWALPSLSTLRHNLLGHLVVLAAATLALGVLAAEDGAEHPVPPRAP